MISASFPFIMASVCCNASVSTETTSHILFKPHTRIEKLTNWQKKIITTVNTIRVFFFFFKQAKSLRIESLFFFVQINPAILHEFSYAENSCTIQSKRSFSGTTISQLHDRCVTGNSSALYLCLSTHDFRKIRAQIKFMFYYVIL